MKNKKLVAIIAVLLVAVIAVVAIVMNNKKGEPAAQDAVVIVATNPEYPPFEYVEGEQTVGYDIDMFDAIAKKAGFEYQIEAMDFDAVTSAVAANENTVGLSGISITDERKLSVNFSEGYINAGLVVIVKADSGYETADQLKGKKIGVQLGTTSDFAAEEITGTENVAQYKTFLNAIMDLQGNKVDAVIIDKPVGQAIMASLKDDSLVMVDMGLQADWYGIEVNKNNTELLDKINAALAELQQEGFFDELAQKYFSGEEEAAE
ncbi:MAG: basic amino acid ABC transporter substrate-binding protein [Clostridiales bacterium]|nr:basic amino acid ABC transporter substrate-binding protein [Clostridiales bacterium]